MVIQPKAIILIALLSTPLVLDAQFLGEKEVAQAASKDVVDFTVSSDESDEIILIYNTQDENHFKVLDQDLEVIQTSTIESGWYTPPDFREIIHDDSSYCVFFRTADLESISYYQVNKSGTSKPVYQKYNFEVSAKEKVFADFKHNNKYYILTSIASSKKLVLRVFNSNGLEELQEIDVDIPKMGRHFSKEFYFVDELFPQTINSASHQKKIYLIDNKLYIILDKIPGIGRSLYSTLILSISIPDGTVKHDIIESPARPIHGGNVNSFLFEDKLFRLFVSQEFLDLKIYNILSLESIKTHFIHVSQDFYLLDDKVIREGAGSSFQMNFEETDQTKRAFRLLNAGAPSIFIRRIDDSRLQVIAGSFYYPNNGSVMPMGNIGPSGIAPTMYVTSYQGNENGVKAYFTSTIDGGDFEKVSSYPFKDELSKKSENFSKQFKKVKQFAIIRTSDGYRMALYDLHKKSIIISGNQSF